MLALLLTLLLALGLLTACGQIAQDVTDQLIDELENSLEVLPEEDGENARETAPEETAEPDAPAETGAVPDEDGEYSTPEEVAEYLHIYGHLPPNFLTKSEALDLGWDSGEDLWDYAPGMSIGGDRFGNYEGLLPEDGSYRECDVNYYGGRRGAERIVFDTEGGIWYTDDHYESFTQLYEGGDA